MLPASKHVLSVYEEILKSQKEGQFFIDSSTIDPHSTKKVYEMLKKKNGKFIDAP
jgi:3-hydroxyisobutyrate dehydrogenase